MAIHGFAYYSAVKQRRVAKMTCRFLPFVLLLAACGGANADEVHWRIKPEHAQCLKTHIGDYRSASGDPVIIALQVCPETDRAAMVMAMQKNSAPGIREKSQSDFDEIIIFNQDELQCLEERHFVAAGSVTLLPKTIDCPR